MRNQLRSVFAVRADEPMVVVSVLELAPIVDDEPDEGVLPWAVDDWVVVLLELPAAVSDDGVVEPLVVAPAPVLGVADVEPLVVPALPGVVLPPAAGAVLPVALLEPDVVPPELCAHARPNAPAIEAARTVMPNFL